VPIDIKSLTSEELRATLDGWRQPAFRTAQVLSWLYSRRATTWDAMTNLPGFLRDRLRREFSLSELELIRKQGAPDTTQKFLWRLPDLSLVESVLIPASPALYGEPSDRHTLCISTQVGCAYGCKFCASGLLGWKRNLRAEEIVDQVLAVERWNSSRRRGAASGTHPAVPRSPEDPQRSAPGARLVSNLVVMGMGEPLANYENLLKALRILNASWGGGIGARKITISTSGLAPQIRRLADEPLQFRLALSLHGATDAVRSRLMPINRKYPLRELIAACECYQARRARMITLEYILIAGVNDGLDQVAPLAALARKLNAKINLIPYNAVEGLDWERPDERAQEAFLKALEHQRVTATLRREKGGEIDAACGQLRLKTERQAAAEPEGEDAGPRALAPKSRAK
jgi:23S rRNA (adenine2503-C2)-methyltransferase